MALPITILIADDDVDIRNIVAYVCRNLGHTVVAVDNGTDAWNALRQPNGPRMAILDWQMPGMTGPEICRKIKATADLPFIYTMLLTARDSREDMLQGLASGAEEYLSKPIDRALLVSRLTVASRVIEAVPPKEWTTPQVPGYRITRLLGKGNFGAVWEAYRESTGQRTALKIIRRDLVTPTLLQRFARELEIAGQFSHRNVARVYDGRMDEVYCYCAMEFVEGKELDKYVLEQKPSPRQLLAILAQVCAGVEHVHKLSVVHRDLKPQNILVTQEGVIKVVDFGLAKKVLDDGPDAGTLTVDNIAVGTPLYMAPEQAQGRNDEIDIRADVYALGVLAYVLLLRRHPHKLDHSSRQAIVKTIAQDRIRRPRVFQQSIHRDLEAILLRALSRDPAERYASAGGLGADIQRFLNTEFEPFAAGENAVSPDAS